MGTLEPRKNVGALLGPMPALARDPDAPPLVAGGPRRAAATPWLARLRSRRLPGHVRHLGYVQRDERATTLSRGLDAGAAVAREGLRHAGARSDDGRRPGGRAATAARCRKWSGDAGQIVEPDDPEALADAMKRLLDDPALRAATATARASSGRGTSLGRERRDAARRPTRGDRAAPIARVTRPLTIGIDARELLGEPTGVGRYLGELLRRWTARPDAARAALRAVHARAACPCRLPTGTADVRVVGAGSGPRHLVGADASPARRPPRFARRLLRAAPTPRRWARRAARRHHPRRLVRRRIPTGSAPREGLRRRLADPAGRARRGGRLHRLGVLARRDSRRACGRPRRASA